MLSLLSILSPSQPLMLFVNTSGVPAVPCFPPVVGILTIQSIAVLHTNMVSPALLNSTPFAPKGGTPSGGLPLFGRSVGSGPAQTVAGCDGAQKFASDGGVYFQMMPLNESEM